MHLFSLKCILLTNSWNLNIAYASCVEANLADGTYELTPATKEGSAELHHVEAEQEIPEASNNPLTNIIQEGKPRSITLVSKIMHYLC